MFPWKKVRCPVHTGIAMAAVSPTGPKKAVKLYRPTSGYVPAAGRSFRAACVRGDPRKYVRPRPRAFHVRDCISANTHARRMMLRLVGTTGMVYKRGQNVVWMCFKLRF